MARGISRRVGFKDVGFSRCAVGDQLRQRGEVREIGERRAIGDAELVGEQRRIFGAGSETQDAAGVADHGLA